MTTAVTATGTPLTGIPEIQTGIPTGNAGTAGVFVRRCRDWQGFRPVMEGRFGILQQLSMNGIQVPLAC